MNCCFSQNLTNQVSSLICVAGYGNLYRQLQQISSKLNEYLLKHSHTLKNTLWRLANTTTKNSKIICPRYHKWGNSNENNVTRSKHKFYKHNQINEASPFGNFRSALFWFSCSDFPLHVILISVCHLCSCLYKIFCFTIIRGL